MTRNLSSYVAASAFAWLALANLPEIGHPVEATAAKNWSQWGGSAQRNNAPEGKDIPTEWIVGDFDYATGKWDASRAKNIKWVARLGSQAFGNPVVHDGKIFVGTNNGGGYLARYKPDVDLGCMLCFDLESGQFLWQHSSEKLPTGRVHDWPLQGTCSAAYAEGDRMWFVTSRGEVCCLDVEGFHDDENDGPYQEETHVAKDEADVVWIVDMMKELHISQHHMCSCSVTSVGDLLFVNTSNGVDVDNRYVPAPEAPSFLAMDKKTGKVLWTDNSPGANILDGQWSSPAYALVNGEPQVYFGGGDAWLYALDPRGDGQGRSKLLWKFDANPKTAKFQPMGHGTRNDIIGTPVIYKNRVYFAVGQDPEHGDGIGRLWCLDPTKRGDVSAELAFNKADLSQPVPHKRVQAVVPEEGDIAQPNPNSAVIWQYAEADLNNDGKIAFEETMHRTCGTVAIRDDLLYIADFSGLFHCIDAMTGKVHWSYDMLSSAWGSPLIVDDKVYIGNEDGGICVFRHSADPQIAMKEQGGEPVPFYGINEMGASVYGAPIVADNVLYISTNTHLFAITPGGK